MDRESLELFLGQGLSVAQIGRRLGLHPSTVSYWMKKYGLVAVHHRRHARRGGLRREDLERLVREGATYAEMAAKLGVSAATIRYWLQKFGLRSEASLNRQLSRDAKRAGRATVRRHCRSHGLTDFFLEGRGYYRCLECRKQRVADRRRKVKAILVSEAGGSCRICGYDRYVGALQFHHLDPEQKRLSLSLRGITYSLERMREEASKCVLLCSNCHAEVEIGLTELPRDAQPAPAQLRN